MSVKEAERFSKGAHSICYLCGETGATSKDHVPPKVFLPTLPGSKSQRLTLKVHVLCNNKYSADEEYLRDLIAPEAQFFGMPSAAAVSSAADRALARPQGRRRRSKMLSNSVSMEIRESRSGLIRMARGVKPDAARVHNVGRKIARGIIFHDTQCVVSQDRTMVHQFPGHAVEDLKHIGRESGDPYWDALLQENCLHTNFSNDVAVRRLYTLEGTAPILLRANMAIMLLTQFYYVVADFQPDEERFEALANRGMVMANPKHMVRSDGS